MKTKILKSTLENLNRRENFLQKKFYEFLNDFSKLKLFKFSKLFFHQILANFKKLKRVKFPAILRKVCLSFLKLEIPLFKFSISPDLVL